MAAAAENKFSLLASLTSLPIADNEGMAHDVDHDHDDDNILPPLAVEEESAGSARAGVNAKAKAGGLLSSSGLLTTLEATATAAGGGLFDQLEEEEERKAQEEARWQAMRQNDDMERAEQRERAAVAAAAQAAAAAAMEESITAGHAASASASASAAGENSVIMGGLQELSLNDDADAGYSNAHNAYSNVNGGQIPMQYPPQQPPPVPQEQYPQPSHTRQQQQQIQQAGYGASSYYYSTTGNVQQIHQQQPNPNQSTMAYSNTAAAPNQNLTNGLSSSSYAQRSHTFQNPTTSLPNGNHSHTAPTTINHNAPTPNNHNATNTAITSSPYSQPSLSNQQPPPQQQQQIHHHNQQHQQQHHHHHHNMHPSHHPNTPITTTNGINRHPNQHPQLNNHNNTQHILNKPKIKPPPYDPSLFKPVFGPITVTDPILVQSPGVFSGPPHWIYNVLVRDVKKIPGQEDFSQVVSNVRRRFRHFVALEDRLRADCIGAILPPRPDKHTTRAIDEASARQSTQFALQRSRELEQYLNALRLHPLAGKAPNLQLFLTLPDHIGAAWPEVSSSIFTRLTEVGASTAVKITEGTSAVMMELNNESQIMAGEDNSELLALASSEGLRIGSVLQAVPKIEGAIAVLGELGERMSVGGLETQKLVNNVLAHDREYCTPFEILSSGLLRSGRRTSRLAVEVGAATQVFTTQYKLCRYERMAFADRRSALVRRRDARIAADKKAQKLAVHQHSMHNMGDRGYVGNAERDAVMSDEIAVGSFNEAETIGQILQCEVGRIADMRRKDWSMSLKVIAANMREAHAERASIWENCRNTFTAEMNAFDGAAHNSVTDNGHGLSESIEGVVNSSPEAMN